MAGTLTSSERGPIYTQLNYFEPQEGRYCVAHAVNNLLGNTGVDPKKWNHVRVGCRPGTLAREEPGITKTVDMREIKSKMRPEVTKEGDFTLLEMKAAVNQYGLHLKAVVDGRWYPTNFLRKRMQADELGVMPPPAEAIAEYCKRAARGGSRASPLLGFLYTTHHHASAITSPQFHGTNFEALAFIDSQDALCKYGKAPLLMSMSEDQLDPARVYLIYAVHYEPAEAARERTVLSLWKLEEEEEEEEDDDADSQATEAHAGPPSDEVDEQDEMSAKELDDWAVSTAASLKPSQAPSQNQTKKRKRVTAKKEEAETGYAWGDVPAVIDVDSVELQKGNLCGAHAINNLMGNSGVAAAVGLYGSTVLCKRSSGTAKPNLQRIADDQHAAVAENYKGSDYPKKPLDGQFSIEVLEMALKQLGCVVRWGLYTPYTATQKGAQKLSMKDALQGYCESWAPSKGELVGFLMGYEAQGEGGTWIPHYACITGPEFDGRDYTQLGFIDSLMSATAAKKLEVPAWSTFDKTLPKRQPYLFPVHYNPEAAAEASPPPAPYVQDDEVQVLGVTEAPKKRKKRPA